MPNVTRPEDLPPYPYTAATMLVRVLGAVSLAGGLVSLLGALGTAGLGWMNRPPLGLDGWAAWVHPVWTAGLATGGVGLLLLKEWGRWIAASACAVVVGLGGYALVMNALARLTDWVWAAAVIGALLLAYSLVYPLAPAFRHTSPQPSPPLRRMHGDSSRR